MSTWPVSQLCWFWLSIENSCFIRCSGDNVVYKLTFYNLCYIKCASGSLINILLSWMCTLEMSHLLGVQCTVLCNLSWLIIWWVTFSNEMWKYVSSVYAFVCFCCLSLFVLVTCDVWCCVCSTFHLSDLQLILTLQFHVSALNLSGTLFSFDGTFHVSYVIVLCKLMCTHHLLTCWDTPLFQGKIFLTISDHLTAVGKR